MNRLILSAAIPALLLAACAGGPAQMEVPALTVADVPRPLQTPPPHMPTDLSPAGVRAAAGNTVSVLYTGKLMDGKVFDSSASANNVPISFVLSAACCIGSATPKASIVASITVSRTT